MNDSKKRIRQITDTVQKNDKPFQKWEYVETMEQNSKTAKIMKNKIFFHKKEKKHSKQC